MGFNSAPYYPSLSMLRPFAASCSSSTSPISRPCLFTLRFFVADCPSQSLKSSAIYRPRSPPSASPPALLRCLLVILGLNWMISISGQCRRLTRTSTKRTYLMFLVGGSGFFANVCVRTEGTSVSVPVFENSCLPCNSKRPPSIPFARDHAGRC